MRSYALITGASSGIGLALAEGIPVVVDRQALALRRQHQKHPLRGAVATRSADHQRIRTQRPGAERFASIQLEVFLARVQLQTEVAAIGGIAPEPALARRASQPVALLLGTAVQQDGRHLQVVEGEQVGQRAVGGGQVTDDAVDLRPGPLVAVEALRNGQRQ